MIVYVGDVIWWNYVEDDVVYDVVLIWDYVVVDDEGVFFEFVIEDKVVVVVDVIGVWDICFG